MHGAAKETRLHCPPFPARPWLASYRANGIPFDIDPDACASVVHLMEAAMRRFPDRTAFRADGQSLTFAEIDRQSQAFAAWLQHTLRIRTGDRVALMLPNVLAFPVASLGILRAGAVQVNINPLYTARELAHQLGDAGVKAIVVCRQARAVLAEAMSATPVAHVIVVDAGNEGHDGDDGDDGAIDFAAAVRAGALQPYAPVPLCGDDVLFLQYTGGTSGLSKGAVLTHRNLLANIAQFKAISPDALRAGAETIVTAIPLYHIFALMVNFLAYFSVGAENWLVANPRDGNAFIDVLEQARATVFVGVNTLYASLLAHPRIGAVDFAPLRLSIGGGAAVLRTVSDQWLARTGTFIREGYGLTETAPVLTFNPASVRSFNGSTGLPVPGTDIVLLDDEGMPVAPGQPGEVCARGPQVMRGYWRQPEANAQAFTADGYFRTGDIGVFNPDGFLAIVDRKKDIVIVSGFNVYPNEVEAVASTCPGVAECACTGMPDARTGEALVLYVVTAAHAILDADTVVAWCRTLLTAYKVPKTIRFVDALPKSAVGKILRRELRRELGR